MWDKVTKKTEFRMHKGANVDRTKLRAFFDQNKIIKFGRIPKKQDWERFFSTGRNTANLINATKYEMPYSDHDRVFKTETGEICYISQPYPNIEDIKSELIQWASDRNLEIDFYDSSHSWYYPNNTTLLVLHLPKISFIIP